MDDLVLSICTASRNRLTHLQALDQALRAQWIKGYEWLVAESYDAGRPILSSPVGMYHVPAEGATAALNHIFPETQGRYVLLLCDDMLPSPGTLACAVAFMDAHPTVGQGALYLKTEAHRCHIPEWGGWMYGQVWIVRRDVGEQVGWYDSRCRHAGVDNDFSAKILDAGYGVVAIPGACVVTQDPRDETHRESAERSVEDMKMIEARWRPHQPGLAQQWKDHWKPLSGGFECGRDHAVAR